MRVSGRIDDKPRLEPANQISHLPRVRDVKIVASHAERFETVPAGTVYQFVTDLATGSAY